MDSQCPVIENVDGNSNREDLNDTTAINDNELPSLNDNKFQEQSNEEEKRNLVNLQPAGEVKESAGGGEEVEKTEKEQYFTPTDRRSRSPPPLLIARVPYVSQHVNNREIRRGAGGGVK